MFRGRIKQSEDEGKRSKEEFTQMEEHEMKSFQYKFRTLKVRDLRHQA
jgi:hypothetical protein